MAETHFWREKHIKNLLAQIYAHSQKLCAPDGAKSMRWMQPKTQKLRSGQMRRRLSSVFRGATWTVQLELHLYLLGRSSFLRFDNEEVGSAGIFCDHPHSLELPEHSGDRLKGLRPVFLPIELPVELENQ